MFSLGVSDYVSTKHGPERWDCNQEGCYSVRLLLPLYNCEIIKQWSLSTKATHSRYRGLTHLGGNHADIISICFVSLTRYLADVIWDFESLFMPMWLPFA